MNMEFIGFTLYIIGEIMIAFTVIMVHHRFLKEHKVDRLVFKTMKMEQKIGLTGIVLIIVGYFLQVPFKF